MTTIRLGTRGSALARWQADWVAGALRQHGIDVAIIEIKTRGDLVQEGPIARIGATGVFTKEIQRALLDGTVDVAVHSLKDLPTERVDGLTLAAVPKRAAYRDAFLSRNAKTLDELPPGSVIGTGSLRRQTQIVHRFGDRFRVEDIRGNVETRLRKLTDGEVDALVLAEAGLSRLGFADRIASFLEPPWFLPAVGQGALGIEVRTDDSTATEAVVRLRDESTFAAVLAEREMLRTLQGGCIAPIAALGTVEAGRLTLHGRILSLDGAAMFERTEAAASGESPESLGRRVGTLLLQAGADRIIAELQRRREMGN